MSPEWSIPCWPRGHSMVYHLVPGRRLGCAFRRGDSTGQQAQLSGFSRGAVAMPRRRAGRHFGYQWLGLVSRASSRQRTAERRCAGFKIEVYDAGNLLTSR